MWTKLLQVLGCFLAISAAAYADIPGCSPDSRSPNDSVLDAGDVSLAQNGGRLCNFSHQGYEHVCEDALSNTTCEIIELAGNRLRSLPSTVFKYVNNLRELYLDGNNIDKVPVFINDRLDFLSMNNNPLEQFSNKSTIGLLKLRILSVENCPNLSAIDKAVFKQNDKLERVRFSGTPLKKLPCSNCFIVTLDSSDTVNLMCVSGSANVIFESKRAENFFLNEKVEMFVQTTGNHSFTNRLICIDQANSESAKPNSAPLALITAIILSLCFYHMVCNGVYIY